MPSAEIPKPENIRRMVTGPKSENRSIRKSRSMGGGPISSSRRTPGPIYSATSIRRGDRDLSHNLIFVVMGPGVRRDDGEKSVLGLCRRQLHRLAAAAGADLVRIVEDELRLHLVGLVVHLGAEQKQHRLGIDQNLDALVLDDLVGRLHVGGLFD